MGTDPDEPSGAVVLCALAAPELLVPDATLDGRFCGNPPITGEPQMRLYPGAPIVSRGAVLGMVGVLDPRPRLNGGPSSGSR